MPIARVDVVVVDARRGRRRRRAGGTTRARAGGTTRRDVALVGVVGLACATTVGEARARARAVVRVDGALAPDGELAIDIVLPRGYHFTEGARSRYEVTPTGREGTLGEDGRALARAERRAMGDANELAVECLVYFCREEDVCLLQRVRFEVEVREGGAREVNARFDVAPEASESEAPEWNRFAVEL